MCSLRLCARHRSERTIIAMARGQRRLAVPILLLFGTLAGNPASGQVTPRWFDINPSQSNTDSDNPNGASGGRVNHVGAAIDFSKVYAATEWGGLYQSFDQGNTWVRINTFAPSAAWDVKVDPNNSQRVYATSSFDGRALNPQSGISISQDAGGSWVSVNIPGLNTLNCTVASRKTQPGAWAIAINAAVPSFVFVGTSCGLARSLDSGGTWTFIDPSPGDSAEQIYSVVAQGRGTVDVIGDNGHFRSTDNGTNWSPVRVTLPGPIAGNSGPRSTVAVSPAESYVLLAADGNNIFESDDGGATWPTSLVLPLRSGQSNQQGRIPFIKTNQLSSSNQFDVWFGDVNLFKTTAITPSTAAPGGSPRAPLNSWTNVQNNGHWDVGDVMFDPRFRSGACPSLFTNDGGVYRNTDRNNPGCQSPNWDQPTITPHATWLWGFDGLRLSPGLHALTYGLQDDGGFAATIVAEGFSPPPPNWNNYNCCDVSANSHGAGKILSVEGSFGTGRAFRLYIRNRDGSGENEIPNYPSSQNISAFVSGQQVAPFGGTGYVLNQTDGVYFTNDINSSPIGWTPLNAPTAATSGAGNVKIATFGTRPNVYYHTASGNPESRGVLFRSTLVGGAAVPGSNWVQMPLPPGIGSLTVHDVDPNNGDRVIVAGINSASNNFEIWKTSDFGVNWTRLTNLENAMLGVTPGGAATFLNRSSEGRNTGTLNFGTLWQPSLLKFDPLDPTTIIAGAIDAGVFLSLDDGGSWQLISNPTAPTSASPHIPRPLFAYFSPGRFNASTASFDVWVGTRGAGVVKAVIDQRRGD